MYKIVRKTKYVLLVTAILSLLPDPSYSQRIINDSLSITAEMPKTINQENDLVLKITFKNLSPRILLIYTHLEEGFENDFSKNFNLVIQKSENSTFSDCCVRTYTYGYSEKEPAYSDLAKDTLLPMNSKSLSFNINSVAGFSKAYYRLKFGIRSGANIIYDKDSNTSDVNLKYIYSDGWIYFRVNKPFNRKRE